MLSFSHSWESSPAEDKLLQMKKGPTNPGLCCTPGLQDPKGVPEITPFPGSGGLIHAPTPPGHAREMPERRAQRSRGALPPLLWGHWCIYDDKGPACLISYPTCLVNPPHSPADDAVSRCRLALLGTVQECILNSHMSWMILTQV